VFVSDQFLPVVEQIRTDMTKVRHWILLGTERRPWTEHVDDLIAAGSPEPLSVELPAMTGMIGYTGGTTGRPKGAIRRTFAREALEGYIDAYDLADPAHVHLVAGPLYHAAPGFFANLARLCGHTAVIMPRFDAEEALRLIERHRCTTTFMAPTLLKRIVDLPAEVRARYDVSSMRAIIMAAAPCPMSTKERVLDYFGPVLYEFYGSTELALNTVLRPEEMLRKPGSCGRALPGVEIAVLDDFGEPVPVGTPGELFVKRSGATLDEYYKKPEATQRMARGDWLSVGDVAYLDDEGFVYICDRKTDMIISGGANIYPAEVEEALHRHPAVADAAVFGVPNEEWGERVHAAIQLQAGATATADDLVAFARQHLAGYKVPRQVSFHTELPRGADGKLLKRLLREPYWAGRAARI
jgi:fatty-acyl-CoA synthase/long-chain acyl-CoA synthetase